MRPLPLFFVFAFAGCGTPDPCAKDPVRCQDAGSDGPDGPGSCAGMCVPPAPGKWLATSLLWIGGPNDTPPPCPAVMPAPFPGFADTPPTVVCPACSCSPTISQCGLPVQFSANQNACPGGADAQQFNAPKSWDGTCNATDPVLTAASLTVTPPPSPFSYCEPVVVGVVTIQGPTAALQCEGMPSVAAGTCGDQSKVCAFPTTDGFLTCVVNLGDQQCPDGWPTKHLVFSNSQACGCQCDKPVGDSCSATVTVFEDGACANPLGSVVVSSDQPQGCVDVAASSAFGSKSSTPPIYKAGTCTPKTVTEGAPFTFCCLP